MNEHWSKLFILQFRQPQRMHTIELLEPIEWVACVGFQWPMYMHAYDYPVKVRDYWTPTLGLDGVA